MIELVDAKRETSAQQWLVNVYPFYLHDLSEFDDTYYRLNPSGSWEPDHLPDWLTQSMQQALIIEADRQRVGFALVGQRPFRFMSPQADHRLCEFFILKRHRRRGLGSAAARAVLDRFPGVWEVAQLSRNLAAIAFWRQLIAAYTNGSYHETCGGEEIRQFFRSRASAP